MQTKEELRLIAQDYRKRNPERTRLASNKASQKRRRLVNLLKMDRPCYDCGNVFPPVCMDWDHLPQFEKSFNIGVDQDSRRFDLVIDEINKCQLVCSNCHRIRTQARKLEGKGN